MRVILAVLYATSVSCFAPVSIVVRSNHEMMLNTRWAGIHQVGVGGTARVAGASSTISSLSSSSALRMAGFGAKSAEKVKPIGHGKTAVENQERTFADQLKAEKPTGVVYARIAGDEEWSKVGTVSAEKPEELELAAYAQKRMILERAVILHTNLIVKKKDLEVGLRVANEEEINTVKKLTYNGEVVGLQMDYVMGSGFYKNAKAPSQEALQVAREGEEEELEKAKAQEETAAAP